MSEKKNFWAQEIGTQNAVQKFGALSPEGDVTASWSVTGVDGRHFITLDEDGKRTGWTTINAPGAIQINAGEDIVNLPDKDTGTGEKTGRSFRVKGELVAQSFIRQDLDTTAEFTLFEDDHTLKATYSGVVPDLFFDEHSEIILHGVYGPDEVFRAETVSVLCPSKYEGLDEEGDP